MMNFIRTALFVPMLNFVDLIVLMLVFGRFQILPAIGIWMVYSLFVSRQLVKFFAPAQSPPTPKS